VAVSAASAMSLKRSISSLDLAADARATRARSARAKATIKLGPFGADPFGDRAASEDLPQLESQRCADERAEQMKQYNQQYMARPEVKAKRAEQMKQYNNWLKRYMASPDVEQLKQYMAMPEVKAKRAEYNKRYMARPEVKQQYKDAAEQAETSKLPGAYWAELSKATIKLGPFGADPFGDGAASEDLPQPESQPGAMGPCRECSACGAEVFAEYRRFCLPCGLRLPLTPSSQCPSASPSASPSRSRSPSPSPSRL